MTATTELKPGERCPTCSRRVGPLTQKQILDELIPTSPDPIAEAHPITEEETAAYEAWQEAQAVVDQTRADHRDARRKLAQARNRGGPAERTRAEEIERAAVERAAAAAVKEAEEIRNQAQRAYRELAKARSDRIARARDEDYRRSVEERARLHEAEAQSGGALKRLGQMLRRRPEAAPSDGRAERSNLRGGEVAGGGGTDGSH